MLLPAPLALSAKSIMTSTTGDPAKIEALAKQVEGLGYKEVAACLRTKAKSLPPPKAGDKTCDDIIGALPAALASAYKPIMASMTADPVAVEAAATQLDAMGYKDAATCLRAKAKTLPPKSTGGPTGVVLGMDCDTVGTKLPSTPKLLTLPDGSDAGPRQVYTIAMLNPLAKPDDLEGSALLFDGLAMTTGNSDYKDAASCLRNRAAALRAAGVPSTGTPGTATLPPFTLPSEWTGGNI
jgi:hypothetical protein